VVDLTLPTDVAFLRLEIETLDDEHYTLIAYVDETTHTWTACTVNYHDADGTLILDRAWTADNIRSSGILKRTVGTLLQAAHTAGYSTAEFHGMTSTQEVIARGAQALSKTDVRVPMPGTLYDWLQGELTTLTA
jgi:predicted GNAT family acetyltransferase